MTDDGEDADGIKVARRRFFHRDVFLRDEKEFCVLRGRRRGECLQRRGAGNLHGNLYIGKSDDAAQRDDGKDQFSRVLGERGGIACGICMVVFGFVHIVSGNMPRGRVILYKTVKICHSILSYIFRKVYTFSHIFTTFRNIFNK